ncbi:acetyltransferase (GNAT) family protein [mine drainage metagenome]|uniref:Acetyltransferase (GNAT) family protein n=1 Tax=mine drainage metagenome TaxID=410659 RepID=A0A1J5S9B2_9ZZZZ
MQNVVVRNIEPNDNAALASIIRRSLEEFNAAKYGTVYFDKATDHLYELFSSTPNSIYFVAELNGTIIGGAGIFPTANLPEGYCELVKMYLSKDARGLGLGRMMISKCLEAAKEMGFTKVYLESMPELSRAIQVYEKFGFKYLKGSLGNSGHTGCDIWMEKEL